MYSVYVIFFIGLWNSSDHVPLLKLNAQGTVHLTFFLSIKANFPSPADMTVIVLLLIKYLFKISHFKDEPPKHCGSK